MVKALIEAARRRLTKHDTVVATRKTSALASLLSRWISHGWVAVQVRAFEVNRYCLAGTETEAPPSDEVSDFVARRGRNGDAVASAVHI